MKKGNIIASIICILISIYVIIVAMGYPKAAAYGTGVPGPGMWPICIAACMLVTSIALLISTLRKPKAEDSKIEMWSTGTKRVYLTMILLTIYVAVLGFLGFIISTIVMLFGFMQWFGRRKPWITMLIAVGVTLVTYSIFKFILNVPVDFGLFYI